MGNMQGCCWRMGWRQITQMSLKAEWQDESWKRLDQWWQQNWVWQWCKGQKADKWIQIFLIKLTFKSHLKKTQKYPIKIKILIKFKGYILWSNPLTINKVWRNALFLSSHEPNFILLHLQQGKKRDKPRPQGSGGFGLLPPPPGGKIAPPPSSGLSNHNIVPQMGSTATGMQTDFT